MGVGVLIGVLLGVLIGVLLLLIHGALVGTAGPSAVVGAGGRDAQRGADVEPTTLPGVAQLLARAVEGVRGIATVIEGSSGKGLLGVAIAAGGEDVGAIVLTLSLTVAMASAKGFDVGAELQVLGVVDVAPSLVDAAVSVGVGAFDRSMQF